MRKENTVLSLPSYVQTVLEVIIKQSKRCISVTHADWVYIVPKKLKTIVLARHVTQGCTRMKKEKQAVKNALKGFIKADMVSLGVSTVQQVIVNLPKHRWFALNVPLDIMQMWKNLHRAGLVLVDGMPFTTLVQIVKGVMPGHIQEALRVACLLYTSPSPRD